MKLLCNECRRKFVKVIGVRHLGGWSYAPTRVDLTSDIPVYCVYCGSATVGDDTYQMHQADNGAPMLYEVEMAALERRAMEKTMAKIIEALPGQREEVARRVARERAAKERRVMGVRVDTDTGRYFIHPLYKDGKVNEEYSPLGPLLCAVPHVF